jgi:hypothetical protein
VAGDSYAGAGSGGRQGLPEAREASDRGAREPRSAAREARRPGHDRHDPGEDRVWQGLLSWSGCHLFILHFMLVMYDSFVIMVIGIDDAMLGALFISMFAQSIFKEMS